MGFACGKNKEAKTKPNKQHIQADLTLSLKTVNSPLVYCCSPSA